ncbi:MAG: DegT/DnrJ/EryC1/StrS family aminotransferase [Synechocystis sp.]|nr:DegT/DnrJ/EryC1/StrS family aminotransferase [Synechocystis sp.]
MIESRRPIPISLPATGEEEWLALKEPLMAGWLTTGPKVAEFERVWADRHQVKHAIAVTSCTTALHLVLVALGIGPGDEVIVPAFTWVSTANVVMYCGATPIFVDVDPLTFNLDVSQLAVKITPKTRAIIPVHLFGLCADMQAIAAIAPGIPLIEDAACAVGSFYHGQMAGSLGLAGAFSLHPRKIITTGEGGMITTNDDDLADKMRILRNHGASVSEEQRHRGAKPYLLPEFNLLGFNYRMTDLQGAVGLVQLSKLDSLLAERQYWANFYTDSLKNLDWLRPPVIPEGYQSGWQAYVCWVEEVQAPLPRNVLMEQLQAQGISTRPGTHALHLLGYYQQKFEFQPDDFPQARDCDRYSLALPLHHRMTAEDYAFVVETLKNLS